MLWSNIFYRVKTVNAVVNLMGRQFFKRLWVINHYRVIRHKWGLLLLAFMASQVSAQACTTIKIEAENFLWMSGVQTEVTTDSGGGLNVGWIDTGDWMSFGVTLPAAGNYTLSYRVASNVAAGGKLRLETDAGATRLGELNVPYTQGWQKWTTTSHTVNFPFQGYKSIAIAVPQGGWNLNWFSLTPQNCLEPISAQQAASQMGKGFNLGQMFENTQHPRTFAEAKLKIDAYYHKGFRTVRIPITWTDFVGGDRLVFDPAVGQVNRNHPRLQEIIKTVDYALSLPGLYVVINAHHERDLKTYSRWQVLETLWRDISDIFKSRNHRLLFEILNEPHKNDGINSPMPASDLRFMTGKAYQAIRAVDGQRIVIIGGNQWFNYQEMANVWPNLNDVGGGNDAYVMATFHHYNPWSFHGNGQGDFADAWTNYDMQNPMNVMKNWANGIGHGMPVYIGEWGTAWGSRYSVMQCNNIRLWYQMFYQDIARNKAMPATVWDDGGWFKLFDHSTDSFNNNLVDCIGGSCNWDSGERYNSACY